MPILRKIQEDPELRLQLIAGGMHLSPEFGSTVNTIEEDGFEIIERVEMSLLSDTPEAIAKSIGLGVMGFAEVIARLTPDIMLVLGDRFEMYSAVLAALPFNLPVAHIHGGEITQGAIDDALRHSITKLSHLHFVSTTEYRNRVIQLGEDPLKVIVSGAPSLDNVNLKKLMDRQALESQFDLDLSESPLIVTYHPVTLEFEDTLWHVEEMLAALDECSLPTIFTIPNADTGGRIIRQSIEKYVRGRTRARIVGNLGTNAYFSLMTHAVGMVGNSSSGIIEAPSFGLPVVNIGSRQSGRVKGGNVVDVGYSKAEVLGGIKKAAAAEFRAAAMASTNPYHCGKAAKIITDNLKSVTLGRELIQKKFVDLPILSAQSA